MAHPRAALAEAGDVEASLALVERLELDEARAASEHALELVPLGARAALPRAAAGRALAPA
ncbi:MAG TPA: hypothetical protein VE596_09150 [Gaiellaceae bacterium]|jgi:hypothetical protein|nr:hypothetical protein [Gaiellaceae bacterium]